MRGFVVGMLLGLLVGGGGVYGALTKPWQSDEEPVAEVEADAGVEEGKSKGKRKRRGKRRRKGARGDGEGDVFIDEVVELTAAQRQSIWKGPTTGVPPRTVDFEGGDGRSLSAGEIQSGISGAVDRISRCIGDARGNAELRSKITLKMLVDGDGRVTKTRLNAPRYLMENGVYSCVGKVTRSMRFTSTGAHTEVSVPFDLGY